MLERLRIVRWTSIALLALAMPAAWGQQAPYAGSGLLLHGTELDISVPSAELTGEPEQLRQSTIRLSEKWGLRSAYETLEREFATTAAGDHTSLDLTRQIYSSVDSRFLAVGLGWESLDFDNGDSSSGVRLVVEGRLGLGASMFLYGQTAWLPSMEDVTGRSDLQGSELEAGVSYQPAPTFSLRAGYRRFRLNYVDDQSGLEDFSETGGVVMGAGFHW